MSNEDTHRVARRTRIEGEAKAHRRAVPPSPRGAALRLFVTGALPAWVLVACSGPTPHTTDITASAAPSANGAHAGPTKPLTFEAGTAQPSGKTPVDPKTDGDLSEWTGRTEAVDHVAVIVSEKGLFLAGDLDAGYAQGVFVTVGSKVAPLPEIGEWTRGGGTQELDCVHERDYIEGSYVATERPLKPEIAAACREFVATFEKQKATHEARFARSIAIDAKGIAAIDAAGARSPLAGAQVSWKPTESGAIRVEAFLPSSGMPRLAEAPLTALYVLAAASSSGAPPKVAEESAPLELAAPVSYSPHSEIRERIFAMYAEPHYVEDEYVISAGLSYAPGDPEHIESWRHKDTGEAIIQSNAPLFEPAAKVGAIEVGRTNVHSEYLTILKDGAFVDIIAPPAPVKKILERDGEIHVIAFQEAGYSMMIGPKSPTWMVAAIDQAGAVRDAVDLSLLPTDPPPSERCAPMYMGGFEPGKSWANDKWDQLDFVGSCVTGEPGDPKHPQGNMGYQTTLKWDAKKKSYIETMKKLPTPKPAKPKR